MLSIIEVKQCSSTETRIYSVAGLLWSGCAGGSAGCSHYEGSKSRSALTCSRLIFRYRDREIEVEYC